MQFGLSSARKLFAEVSTSLRSRLIALTLIRAVVGLLEPLALLLFGAVVTYLAVGFGEPKGVLREILKILPPSNLGVSSRVAFAFTVGFSVLAVYVLKFAATVASFRATNQVLSRVELEINRKQAAKLLTSNIPLRYKPTIDQVIHGLTTGVNAFCFKHLNSYISILTELVTLSIVTLLILLLQPIAAIASIIYVALLALLVTKYTGSRSKILGVESTLNQIESHAILRDLYSIFVESRLAGAESKFLDRYVTYRGHYVKAIAKSETVAIIPKQVFDLGMIVGVFLLAYFEYYLSDWASATTTLVFFIAAVARIIPSVMSIVTSLNVIKSSSGDLDANALVAQSIEADLNQWVMRGAKQ